MPHFINTKVDKMQKKARHIALTATVIKFMIKDHFRQDERRRNIKFQVTYPSALLYRIWFFRA